MLFRKKKFEDSSPVEFMIVGLGNPGKKYVGTRHNAGFMAMEMLESKLDVRVDRVKFQALVGNCRLDGRRGLLMMPQTFMNNSGVAVREAMQFYKLKPEQVVLIFDDISLPVGKLRIRRHGSDGGQRGAQSIIYQTGSDRFPRVRVGIGAKPHPDYDLADWVLSKFPKEDWETMRQAVADAADAACMIVGGDIDGAMNKYSS